MMKYKKPSRNFITYAAVIVVYLICQLALSGMIDGFKMSRSLKGQLVPICVYIVMAVSLNLTVGISGELSLGHAGFMSVGAFSGILVSRLTDAFSSDLMAAVREKSDLTPQEIRTLSYFQLNGCLAVCRQSLKAGDGEWDQTRCLLDRFVSAGMTAFFKDKQKQDECKDKQSEEGRR